MAHSAVIRQVPDSGPQESLMADPSVPNGATNNELVDPEQKSGTISVLPTRSGMPTRFLAFVALCGVAGGLGYLGHTAYRATRDSFVAPIILSPNSDVVLTNKLKMSELQVERARAVADLERCDTDLRTAEATMGRLEELRKTAASGREWISEVTARQASAAAAEIRALGAQQRVLAGLVEQQTELANRAKSDVQSGIISRSEYAKEVQTLGQMDLAVLDNERARLQGQALMHERVLAQQALARRNGAPMTPELITREEQMVRIEMELLRLQSEQHTKQAQKTALLERIANIDELAEQLNTRPIFQAMERRMDLAFVPYTQLEGVERGSRVFSCTWGVFFCKPVGTVTEVVPGEVTQPDPWGNQARGQYAVLDLSNHESARSKMLRVRTGGEVVNQAKREPDMRQQRSTPAAAPQRTGDQRVSAIPTTRLEHYHLSSR